MQMEVEKLGKRLKAIVKEVLPDRQVHLQRGQGLVTVDWLELVKVECPSKGSSKLLWHNDNLRVTGVTEDVRRTITESFNSNARTRASSQWCL